MTTRIQSGGPSTQVTTGATATRTTAQPAQPFRQVMAASASAIVNGAEQAALRLPGGPILAAAVRSVPGTAPGASAQTPEGVGAASGEITPSSSAGGVENALNQSADQNLYFLELQERISQENRTFTAMSNVLKARHETVKNAIGNIR